MDRPTADCIARIAALDMKPELRWGGRELIGHFVQARQTHLLFDVGSSDARHTDEAILNAVPFEEAIFRIEHGLKQGKQEDLGPSAMRDRLVEIEADLSPVFVVNGEIFHLVDVYQGVATHLLGSLEILGSSDIAYAGGNAEREVVGRRLSAKYGVTLNVFVDRWKELIAPGKWRHFAAAMIDFGRKADAIFAIEKMNSQHEIVRCRKAHLWLRLDELERAESEIKGTRCFWEWAKVAERYQSIGLAPDALRVVSDILLEFNEQYWYAEKSRESDIWMVLDVARLLIRVLSSGGKQSSAIALTEKMLEYKKKTTQRVCDNVSNAELFNDARAYDRAINAIDEAIAAKDFNWNGHCSPGLELFRAGGEQLLSGWLHRKHIDIEYHVADKVYEYALNNRMGVTPEYMQRELGLKDSFRLYYRNISAYIINQDNASAESLIKYIISKEQSVCDVNGMDRYLYLLKRSVFLERKDMALDSARLIISRTFSQEPSGCSQPCGRRHTARLAEAAAILAQLP